MQTKTGLAALALLLAAGCVEDSSTVLKVVVGTDYLGMREVRVRLLDGHGDPLDEHLFDVAHEQLPFSFSVVPPNQNDFGPPPSMTFEAIRDDQSTAFERMIQFSGQVFEGQTMYVYLAAHCETMTCPSDQTCSELGCVDPYMADADMPMRKDGEELESLCIPGDAWCRADGKAVERCVGFGQASEYTDCNADETCHGDPLTCAKDGTTQGDTVRLHIEVTGGGVGEVATQDRSVVCSDSCTFDIPRAANLELFVEPGGDDYFLSWGQGCAGSGLSCFITMHNEIWVEARFERHGTVVNHAVDVFIEGYGSGRVREEGEALDCGTSGGNCHADVSHGSVLTVHAVPDSGSVFVGWQGVCASVQVHSCTFSVESAIAIHPRFEPMPTGSARFDLDGDGFADLVYSAPGAPGGSGTVDAGQVYVQFGPLPPTYLIADNADRVYEGASAHDEFGRAFEVGDMDGDSIDDLLVGAPGYGGKKGAVYAIFGGPGLIGSQNLGAHPEMIEGHRGGELFGASLTLRADLDGDHAPDLVVGAPGDDGMRGVVYIYLASSFANQSGPPTPAVVIGGEQVGDRFGWSVRSAGDLDGDGADELIVGAPRHDVATQQDAGRAYVFKFDTQLASAADAEVVVSGVQPNSLLGFSVSGLGDWQGDIDNEWAVSAHVGDRVLVFSGLPTRKNLTPNLADYEIMGRGFFGASLSGFEDYTGDGRPDLVVGGPIADPGSMGGHGGLARLFAGGGPISSPAFEVNGSCISSGECSTEAVGITVGPIGDLDLDGVMELGVGSLFGGNLYGPSEHGRILVYDINTSDRPVNATADQAVWTVEGGAYDGGACAGLSGAPIYWRSAFDPAPN